MREIMFPVFPPDERERRTRSIQTPFNIRPIGIKGPTTDWLTGEGPHRDTTVKTRSTGKLIFISRDSKIDKARYHLRQAASSIDQQAVRCGTASGVTNCGSLWYGFYASRWVQWVVCFVRWIGDAPFFQIHDAPITPKHVTMLQVDLPGIPDTS